MRKPNRTRSGVRTSATSPPHRRSSTIPQFAFANSTRITASTTQNRVFRNCIRASRSCCLWRGGGRRNRGGGADLRFEAVEQRLDGGEPRPLLRQDGAERLLLQPRD